MEILRKNRREAREAVLDDYPSACARFSWGEARTWLGKSGARREIRYRELAELSARFALDLRAGGVPPVEHHDEEGELALPPGRPWREALEIDSFDFLNILVDLERRLGVSVPESDYHELETLDGLLGYLERRLAA
ncbi:acyl carrier protein [Halomonas ventosae]|uniref:Phosphopantetheine binding protein n=1 Tax=Halomonas ventosae TaxID=229007 RepID=A0A2T0VN79_9GAMM|nr:acyl carrier protein [Halomonas ventosae]PRY71780.1 phosphopantetheine binding protein [Halomonas ventosae]